MKEIVAIVRQYETAIREKLREGRTGIFKMPDGTYQVIGGIELGRRIPGTETIYIFGNEEDLDTFLTFFGEVES